MLQDPFALQAYVEELIHRRHADAAREALARQAAREPRHPVATSVSPIRAPSVRHHLAVGLRLVAARLDPTLASDRSVLMANSR